MGVWLLRFAGFCKYDDPFPVVIHVAVECRMVLWVRLDSRCWILKWKGNCGPRGRTYKTVQLIVLYRGKTRQCYTGQTKPYNRNKNHYSKRPKLQREYPLCAVKILLSLSGPFHAYLFIAYGRVNLSLLISIRSIIDHYTVEEYGS